MELTKLREIRVDAANQALLDDLAPLRETIRAARPLESAVVARLRNELLGDQVHNSNSLEGNALTLRETREVLEAGQIVDVGRRRDSIEALNLAKAIDRVQGTADSPRYADQEFFREVHGVLFAGLRDEIAGRYREHQVFVTGAKHQPPRDFQSQLDQLFKQLSEPSDQHALVTAAWSHWAVARLHPYQDGNGRMARLWQDYILLANDYTPAIIPKSQQKEYYSALESADGGDFSQLLQLVVQSAVATSRTYVNAIRESDTVGDWADQLVEESDQLASDRIRLEYSRWQGRIVELRDAFIRCMTLLNRKSSRMQFNLHSFPVIDMATWETLRTEPRTPKTWCFRIEAASDVGHLEYILFAGKHFHDTNDENFHLPGGHVTVLVSEKSASTESRILKGDNSPITLREVLVVDNEFVRKRWDGERRVNLFERDVTAIRIAQDFLTEIVRHRLTQ
jgi:Fic family protein